MSYSNVVRESLPPEVFELDAVVETYPLNVKGVGITNPALLFDK
jgi:hypothetical protein